MRPRKSRQSSKKRKEKFRWLTAKKCPKETRKQTFAEALDRLAKTQKEPDQ